VAYRLPAPITLYCLKSGYVDLNDIIAINQFGRDKKTNIRNFNIDDFEKKDDKLKVKKGSALASQIEEAIAKGQWGK
jgi:hypothetical protein